MTPGDRAAVEYKKRDARLAAFVHGSIGAVVGAALGFYWWSDLNIRLGLLDSWWGFAIFMAVVTLTFGALAACLKDRFWEDWRGPFWWS
jgi:hypothetical protein